MSKDKMQLFRKSRNSGMHKTLLRAGSQVNGQPAEGWVVLRPGNTVLCAPADLGKMGIRQFDSLSPALVEEEPIVETKPVAAKLGIKKREKSNHWDVINPLNPDKPLNAKALSKKQAEELLAQLLDEPVGQDNPDDLDGLPWDSLVDVLEREGGTVPDEVETEADLAELIRKNRAE